MPRTLEISARTLAAIDDLSLLARTIVEGFISGLHRSPFLGYSTEFSAYRAYTQALTQAGVMIGGAGLQLPGRATTIRLRDGKRQVQDGPFAEAKEQLGGYYVIDVPDLDHALDWAARCPAASTGTIEVRPNLPN